MRTARCSVCFPLDGQSRTSHNDDMTKATSYLVAAIDPSAADELRAHGGINYVVDEQPGFPCRQCLRDAE
ncbi:MAG: hypothetical protein QOJ74_798, partial [Ilumatobacteraceae bacterium]|nr:hypothetical protein [Ilumatobacteraceae bacterium]